MSSVIDFLINVVMWDEALIILSINIYIKFLFSNISLQNSATVNKLHSEGYCCLLSCDTIYPGKLTEFWCNSVMLSAQFDFSGYCNFKWDFSMFAWAGSFQFYYIRRSRRLGEEADLVLERIIIIHCILMTCFIPSPTGQWLDPRNENEWMNEKKKVYKKMNCFVSDWLAWPMACRIDCFPCCNNTDDIAYKKPQQFPSSTVLYLV